MKNRGVFASKEHMKKIQNVLCMQQATQDWARKETQKKELNPKTFRTDERF